MSDEELDAILMRTRAGSDKAGDLTLDEVRTLFHNLKLPADYADRVFKKMDTNNNGKVSRSALKTYVSGKIHRLRHAFSIVDRDGDGLISKSEIKAVLDAAQLKTTVEDAEALVKAMRADDCETCKVSFAQFLSTFALLEPLDMVAMFDKEAQLFELGSAGDLAQFFDKKTPTLTRRQSAQMQKSVNSNEDLPLRLLCAGLAATLAQTACQPIETVKVRMQNEANMAAAKKRYSSFLAGGKVIVSEEGVMALWKGMLPSAVREMSYRCTQFATQFTTQFTSQFTNQFNFFNSTKVQILTP